MSDRNFVLSATLLCKPIEMLGLDNICKTRCLLIYPINKMYGIPEKKPVSNDQIEIYSTK
jgi:hypothetical protein